MQRSKSAGRAVSRRAVTCLVGAVVAVGLIGVALPLSRFASAAGPAYSGPQTGSSGPAYFGPAPNPIPYCENPIYFDPFPENVSPIGRIDPGPAPIASVTTAGTTMDFTLVAEGDPGGQYPGFFPAGGDGGASDQPKGVEMAGGDVARVDLSEPIFYTQWIFTDVDREDEGFDVTPAWTDPANPGGVAVFGGDPNFDFTGTTSTVAQFNDTDFDGQDSESINGRVQVDFLGAVTGIGMARDPGSGQSGFAVGGGCQPIGVAKEVTSGPTWNGSSFDLELTIRVRNNLPSTSTLLADIAAASAGAASSTSTGTPESIDVTNVSLADVLSDPAFSSVNVVNVMNTSGNITVNSGFDGDADPELLVAGQTIAAETEEEFVLSLQYVPDSTADLGPDCSATYDLLNSAKLSGTASGVDVVDISDDGADPDPGVSNGAGGFDDPTVITFECPPEPILLPVLEIVKSVVVGPGGVCPGFDVANLGDGLALGVDVGDTVTYCISVLNSGEGDASLVEVSDPLAPVGFDGVIGDLAAGVESDVLSFDLVVGEAGVVVNTATVMGEGPEGPLDPVADTAVVEAAALLPVLEIVKSVVVGPGGVCPGFDVANLGDGLALGVDVGDTVTYCISVLNSGEGDASLVEVSDPLAPVGFDGVIGDLAAGVESDVLSFDLVVGEAGVVVNTATVMGEGPEGPLDPVADTAVVEAAALLPVLEIVKSVVVGPGGVCPGFDVANLGDGSALEVLETQTVTYCISVRNTGEGTAEEVTVTDPQAPADFDGVIGDVAAGEEAMTLSFDLVVGADTPLKNTATANADGIDPVQDSAIIAVELLDATVEIIKTVIPASGDCEESVDVVNDLYEGNQGDPITWCYVVTNTGNVALANLVVDDVPVGISGVGALATYASNQPALPVGGQVKFSVDATLPDGGQASLITVVGEASKPDGSLLSGIDQVTDTNDAAVRELIADLSVVKSVSDSGPVPAGTALTYTLVVSNAGPDPAEDVTLLDVLPQGIELLTLPDVSNWVCGQADASELECERLEALDAGASETITYQATVTNRAAFEVDLVNTVVVSSTTEDPDLTNNEDIATTEREPMPVVPVTIRPAPPASPPSVRIAPPARPTPPLVTTPVLAHTGSEPVELAAVAAMLITGGGFLVIGARRSRDDRSQRSE